MDDTAKEDQGLLALVALHDATALETLYDRHAPALYALILRILADPIVAQEVLIDTFWQVWQEARKCSNPPGVSLLYTLARQNSTELLRREAAVPPSQMEGNAEHSTDP